MGVYEIIFLKVFETYLINKQIVFQNNIMEKYYEIGRSELCWDISGLYKDGPDICRLLHIIVHMTVHFIFWY